MRSLKNPSLSLPPLILNAPAPDADDPSPSYPAAFFGRPPPSKKLPLDTSEFASLLEGYDFLRLETIARLIGLEKQMSKLGLAHSEENRLDRLRADPRALSARHVRDHGDGTATYEVIDVDGSAGDPMIDHFREMVREGAKGAILSSFYADRAKLLNIARQYASGATGPYKRVFEADTLTRHGHGKLEDAVAEYREVFRGWIPVLESAVQSIETLNQIAAYGVHLEPNGASVAVVSPKGGFERRPREFLAEWGSAYLRLSTAEKLIASGAKAAGYLPEEYDRKDALRQIDDRLIDQVVDQLVEQIPPGEGDAPGNRRDATDAIVFATCWVLAGLPVVQASHRLAASLMATSVPAEAVPEVVIPWHAFLVEVPNDLLGPDSTFDDVAYVGMIANSQNQPIVYLFMRDYARPMVFPLKNVTNLCQLSDVLDVKHPKLDMTSHQIAEVMRSLDLLGRYMLGALIELDDVEHKQKISRGPGRHALDPKHRGGTPPTSWVFQIKRDVKVDVRPYVREYVKDGGGKSLALQRLVRGHSKRQPHGPRGSLRKWIHIEPYWQGPEDAPIALRKHKIA